MKLMSSLPQTGVTFFVLGALTGTAYLHADSIQVPYVFLPGTKIVSAEVNANFQALANVLAALETQVDNLTGQTGGGYRSMQVLDVSGAFTVPEGVTTVMVELWGGGGAGGKPNYTKTQGPEYYLGGGGGGGGGGYARSVLLVSPEVVYSVTVGRGAIGAESTGGTSNFANMLWANGGGRGNDGLGTDPENGVPGGNGGSANGMIAVSGGVGGSGGACSGVAEAYCYNDGLGGTGPLGAQSTRGYSRDDDHPYIRCAPGAVPGGGASGGVSNDNLDNCSGGGGRVVVYY